MKTFLRMNLIASVIQLRNRPDSLLRLVDVLKEDIPGLRYWMKKGVFIMDALEQFAQDNPRATSPDFRKYINGKDETGSYDYRDLFIRGKVPFWLRNIRETEGIYGDQYKYDIDVDTSTLNYKKAWDFVEFPTELTISLKADVYRVNQKEILEQLAAGGKRFILVKDNKAYDFRVFEE